MIRLTMQKIKMHIDRMSLTPTRLLLLVAVFLTASGNWSFLDRVTEVYPFNSNNLGFLVSLTVCFHALVVLLLLVFSLVMTVRLAATVLIVLAAVAGYYADSLGVVVDDTMIRNILQTNINEAADMVNSSLVLHVVLLGLLPVALIWLLPLQKASFLRELRYKLQTAFAAVLVIVLCVLPLSSHYASFLRGHKSLRYYANPGYPVYSIGRYINQQIRSRTVHEFTRLAETVTLASPGKRSRLVILVVGETARTDHFSLNGYERETNPLLAQESRVISYPRVSSCGTSTVISVPCMFAHEGHERFQPDVAEYKENVLDILSRAGVHVLWRDNNSDSKGVAVRLAFEDYKRPGINTHCDIECRDTGMLIGLQAYFDNHPGDILVVLHQMGSHGPAYYKRYPKAFERFRPTCQSVELSSCTNETIINAYDNSILYTDYFLSKVIDLLKQNSNRYETMMLYLSDHGESLGEAGIYLHGLPYLFAPDAQTQVPVILWTSESTDIDFEKTRRLSSQPNSHDVLFSTLLQVFGVQTDLSDNHSPPLLYLTRS